MLDFIKNLLSNFPGLSITAGASILGVILNIILKKTGLIDKIKKLIDKADDAIENAEPAVDKIVKKASYNGGVLLTRKMNNSKAAPIWDTGLEPIVIIVFEGIGKLLMKCVTVFLIKPISNAITFFVTGLRSDNKEVKA